MIEVAIVLFVLVSFPKPKVFTSVIAALLLLRPNERFECFVSYPKLIFPILALSLIFFSDKDDRIKQFKADKQLHCFIAIIVIQTLLFHIDDLGKNVEYLIVGLMFYYAVNLFSKDQDGVKLLNYAIIISCLIITGEAIYYHYTEPTGSIIWNLFHTSKAGRLQAWGNWANANETAFIASIGIANAVFLCVRFRSKLFYVVSAALISFFTMVIFLTASRAGLATLLIIFLPMVVLMDYKVAKVLVAIAIVFTVFLASSFSPERVDLEASSEDRFDLRYRGIQLFKQHPLVGVGFQRARNDLGEQPLHNTYLQVFVETGVIGASFLFYFLYKICMRIYRTICYNKHRKLSNLNMSIVVGLYLGSSFYFLWGNQLLSLLFFLIIAQVQIWLGLEETFNLSGYNSPKLASMEVNNY